MVVPRALVFRPLVKGDEALGTRLKHIEHEVSQLSWHKAARASFSLLWSLACGCLSSRYIFDDKRFQNGYLHFPRSEIKKNGGKRFALANCGKIMYKFMFHSSRNYISLKQDVKNDYWTQCYDSLSFVCGRRKRGRRQVLWHKIK